MRRRAALLAVLAGGAAIALAAGFGMRGESGPPRDLPPVARALPAGELRMVAFGTSLTQNGIWPDAVARRLSECLAMPVSLIRVAQVGATSDWGRGEVRRVGGAAPHLVLIEFAVNDADLIDGMGPGRSRETLRAILSDLRRSAPDAVIVVMSTNPARGLRGWLRPFLPRYFALFREVAEEARAGFFDGAARWRNDLRSADLPDGLHPAPQAEARVIVPALTAFLGNAFGRECG